MQRRNHLNHSRRNTGIRTKSEGHYLPLFCGGGCMSLKEIPYRKKKNKTSSIWIISRPTACIKEISFSHSKRSASLAEGNISWRTHAFKVAGSVPVVHSSASVKVGIFTTGFAVQRLNFKLGLSKTNSPVVITLSWSAVLLTRRLGKGSVKS